MFQFLLLDLDDTILDFHKAEHTAIRKTLREFGIEPTDTVCELYRKINLAHWKALEKKLITRHRLITSRFEQLFAQIGVDSDPVRCGEQYMNNLGQEHDFLPGALDAVVALSNKYKLYLASNGTTNVQVQRIADAKIAPYFQDIFISEQMGADKPDKRFFDASFARIPQFDPTKAMIIGDSLKMVFEIFALLYVIVDIVETGTTLKENDLEVKEEIVPISARLIANKSSFKFKTQEIEKISQFLLEQVKNND